MLRNRYLVVASPLGGDGSTNEISNSLTTVPAETTTSIRLPVVTATASTGTAAVAATTLSDQQQPAMATQNYPSLDKVVKAKLVSNKDMSVSESVDENLLELYNMPMFFGTENSTTVTVQAGAVAHLPCTIHHIGEGVVSQFLSII